MAGTAEFTPNAKWQCPQCLTMNWEPPDEDPKCETCGVPLPPAFLLRELAEVEAPTAAQRTAASPTDTKTFTTEL